MKVEVLDRLQPRTVNASRVLIRNSFGDPIAVVVEYQKDVFMVTHSGMPDFEQVLTNLGVGDIGDVRVITPKPLADYPFTG